MNEHIERMHHRLAYTLVIIVLIMVFLTVIIFSDYYFRKEAACDGITISEFYKELNTSIKYNKRAGSSSSHSMQAPCNSLMVCFIDETRDARSALEEKNIAFAKHYGSNVYVITKERAVPVGNEKLSIRLTDDNALCLPVVNNTILLSTKGEGDYLLLSAQN